MLTSGGAWNRSVCMRRHPNTSEEKEVRAVLNSYTPRFQFLLTGIHCVVLKKRWKYKFKLCLLYPLLDKLLLSQIYKMVGCSPFVQLNYRTSKYRKASSGVTIWEWCVGEPQGFPWSSLSANIVILWAFFEMKLSPRQNHSRCYIGVGVLLQGTSRRWNESPQVKIKGILFRVQLVQLLACWYLIGQRSVFHNDTALLHKKKQKEPKPTF